MEYQKVGRGGAGNYYSQQDTENVEKRSSEDLEKQATATNPTAEDPEKSRSEYAHSGRGGAGNYTNANKLAEATAATTNVTLALQETKPPKTGHYGRGGAGNYRNGNMDAGRKEDARRKSVVQQEAHQQAVKDVESSLKQPEKAYLGVEKLE